MVVAPSPHPCGRRPRLPGEGEVGVDQPVRDRGGDGEGGSALPRAPGAGVPRCTSHPFPGACQRAALLESPGLCVCVCREGLSRLFLPSPAP